MPRLPYLQAVPATSPLDQLLRAHGIQSDHELARRGGPTPRTVRMIRRGREPLRCVILRLAHLLAVPEALVRIACEETARAYGERGAA